MINVYEVGKSFRYGIPKGWLFGTREKSQRKHYWSPNNTKNENAAKRDNSTNNTGRTISLMYTPMTINFFLYFLQHTHLFDNKKNVNKLLHVFKDIKVFFFSMAFKPISIVKMFSCTDSKLTCHDIIFFAKKSWNFFEAFAGNVGIIII